LGAGVDGRRGSGLAPGSRAVASFTAPAPFTGRAVGRELVVREDSEGLDGFFNGGGRLGPSFFSAGLTLCANLVNELLADLAFVGAASGETWLRIPCGVPFDTAGRGRDIVC
jgi:hypothetical protein